MWHLRKITELHCIFINKKSDFFFLPSVVIHMLLAVWPKSRWSSGSRHRTHLQIRQAKVSIGELSLQNWFIWFSLFLLFCFCFVKVQQIGQRVDPEVCNVTDWCYTMHRLLFNIWPYCSTALSSPVVAEVFDPLNALSPLKFYLTCFILLFWHYWLSPPPPILADVQRWRDCFSFRHLYCTSLYFWLYWIKKIKRKKTAFFFPLYP